MPQSEERSDRPQVEGWQDWYPEEKAQDAASGIGRWIVIIAAIVGGIGLLAVLAFVGQLATIAILLWETIARIADAVFF